MFIFKANQIFRKGYIKNNQPNLAIGLFNEISNPNEIVSNLLFNACAELRTPEALNLAKSVSEKMPKAFYFNSYILCSLLDALMKCGDVIHAQSLFDTLKKKTLSMYGAMMKGKKEILKFIKLRDFICRLHRKQFAR